MLEDALYRCFISAANKTNLSFLENVGALPMIIFRHDIVYTGTVVLSEIRAFLGKIPSKVTDKSVCGR